MATFVLVPGAGGMSWYWHRVAPLLRAAGHEAIAVDLPSDDRHAGLALYADTVTRAIGERSNVILVAQSLAGFTAPLVCARAPVRMLAFVNAMIPESGEMAGAWWDATGAAEARKQAAERRGHATEAGRDDRFFPVDFQRRVARERLGKEMDEIPGGHLVALSNAEGLTKRLLAYAKGLMS